MMMNRHRSTSRSRSRATREMESRQPEEDGRRNTTTTTPSNRLNQQQAPNATNNPPRTPRSTATSANVATPPPPSSNGAPSTPHSAPPTSTNASNNLNNNNNKTRCYRLNLEKPFDIRQQKSPLGRDYSGPPVHDSDLPPAQGPVEYLPPPHLCSKEEMAWRRHSWGGCYNGTNTNGSTGPNSVNTPSELMANLHVSVSEESTASAAADPTSIAISTARIFRGIVVDRNGVITSMNSRAMRSQRGKGQDGKTKMGEKSRQAAKIDKAKDLIDEVGEGGGGGASDEENDPTKVVSLFVMGEYEDLNDLVRDGSKKLRDSKSLSDESIFMYNRPRQLPPGANGGVQPMAVSPSNNGGNTPMAMSPNNGAPSSPYNGSTTASTYTTGTQNVSLNPAMDPSGVSPTSASAASTTSSNNLRKRVFSADKSRSRYKQVPRSAPPKLKSHPRDSRSSTGGSSSRSRSGVVSQAPATTPTAPSSRGYSRHSSNVSHATPPVSHGMLNCNPTHVAAHPQEQKQQPQEQQRQQHHYFPQQCNFFPGNSDWTEALGFSSINSLWNCGANGGHMSPTMSPHTSGTNSPRGGGGGGSSHGGPATSPTTGGGVYHGSGAPSAYHPHSHNGAGGYHSPAGGYHAHSQQQQGHHHGANNGGSSGYYGTSGGGGGYRNENVETRNPSYGNYGRGGGNAGVRDTVVM